MNRRAFSLIEVLIAVALLVVLTAAMLGFVTDLLNTRERIETVTSQQRAANTVFDQIEADLMCSIVGDGRFGAGIDGEPHRLRILTRSVAMRHVAETGGDGFATLGDLQRAEYVFDESLHRLRAKRTAASTPNSESSMQNPDDLEEITRSIFNMRFRYHDGTTWRDRFDSREQDRLPIAVEVAIWYEPGPDEEWSEEATDEFDEPDEASEPNRLTFDIGPTFDEQDWAMRADRDFRPERRPDRIRIFAVPDAEESTFDSRMNEEEVF